MDFRNAILGFLQCVSDLYPDSILGKQFSSSGYVANRIGVLRPCKAPSQKQVADYVAHYR
jgi:hypothetical protein